MNLADLTNAANFMKHINKRLSTKSDTKSNKEIANFT